MVEAQNRLFNSDQKELFSELNGENNSSNDNEIPDTDESQKFWSGIWSEEKEHNKDSEWLKILKEVSNFPKQEGLVITTEIVTKQTRKIPNWKALGKDVVQYWLKRLSNLHERTAGQLNKILNRNEQLPEWLTVGRTVLCQKDAVKGNAAENYRPISCLPLMWKLLTGIISEHL